ncbi:putative reverse transcriptase domain-containing protein [Tanacetum coccineum]
MPPRRFKKKSVRKIVEKRVAKAIEKYEKTRADSNNTGGSGSTNTGGTVVPEMHGCSYKTFMNGKPHSFKGTEGVVGLKRWFEKMEQVFEICKCAEDDKVKFAMCTFEGRALTWWNGNVQTLGLANANQIPWSNVKAMMTTEYCPATEIQRMEQELWTLTLKGDDIEAYNNRLKRTGLDVSELGRAARIGESNKRKWEDKPEKNNKITITTTTTTTATITGNRNNNHPPAYKQRQEMSGHMLLAQLEEDLCWKFTTNVIDAITSSMDRCPQKCQSCQRLGHMVKDCRVRPQCCTGNDFLLECDMFRVFGGERTFSRTVSKREPKNDGVVGEAMWWLKIH